MTSDQDINVYRTAFASLKGINPVLAREFLQRTGSEQNFFSATERQLSAVMGFSNRIFDDRYRGELLEKARRETGFISASGIRALYFTDADYPQRLNDVEDAPLMLYALGSADLNRGLMVSVVGTRHATPYGLDFVGRLVADLKEKCAENVINMIYPSQHRAMAAEMVRNNGLLITEYRSDAPVHKGNFIARNRIVASLCDALVVAESARKGGALITARLASGYNRDVFALPGRTSDRYSQGCNRLIACHTAALIQNADDIIDAMGWPRRKNGSEQPTLFRELSPEEQTVMECLTSRGEAHLTTLTMALGAPVSKVMGLLIDMEFKGLVTAYPGGNYRLA